MLIGQFEGKLAAKQQISFPKKFRKLVGERLVITKGFEKHLIAVSQDSWKTLLEGTEGLPFTNTRVRKIQRFLLGNATIVELDKKGRFILPAYLKQHANIQNEIIFAGIERFVEIWSKEEWDKEQKSLASAFPNVFDTLEEGIN